MVKGYTECIRDVPHTEGSYHRAGGAREKNGHRIWTGIYGGPNSAIRAEVSEHMLPTWFRVELH